MSDIQELLDDVKNKCQTLVDEIEAFKQSRVLHERATESLNSMSQALNETKKAIEPFTEERIRKLITILLAMGAFNGLFFIIILLVILLRG